MPVLGQEGWENLNGWRGAKKAPGCGEEHKQCLEEECFFRYWEMERELRTDRPQPPEQLFHRKLKYL